MKTLRLKGPPLGFDLNQRETKIVATLTCHECDATDDIPVTGKLNPQAIIKRFRSSGWECDLRTKRLAKCPTCLNKPKTAHPSPSQDITVDTQIKETKDPVRELTRGQRSGIRNLLDEHFDDNRGCYLNGYSDQKIGQELNLPWAHVTKMREAAYGPILVDTEIERLRGRAAELTGEIKAVETQVLEAMSKLDKMNGALGKLNNDIDAAAMRRQRVA